MAKCIIRKKATEKSYTVTFNLTKLEIDSMKNSLSYIDTPVNKEIVQAIKNAWLQLGL